MATPVPDINSVKTKALRTYAEKFGEQAVVCVYAPGRVNLIGEHTDYNEGFVLPMVIINSRSFLKNKFSHNFLKFLRAKILYCISHLITNTFSLWKNYVFDCAYIIARNANCKTRSINASLACSLTRLKRYLCDVVDQ